MNLTIVTAALLTLATSAAHAACELTPYGKRSYRAFDVQTCEQDPKSLCVLGRNRHGNTYKDRMRTQICNRNGSACIWEGWNFRVKIESRCKGSQNCETLYEVQALSGAPLARCEEPEGPTS